MNNHMDYRGWLATAQEYLQIAESDLGLQNYVPVVHYGQLALEMSAKTIIAYLHEPEWTHDPSDELQDIIRREGRRFEQRLGKATVQEMRRLALNAKQFANWHTWSTYGKREAGKPYQRPSELCTPAIVADLMPRARHAVALATRFSAQFD